MNGAHKAVAVLRAGGQGWGKRGHLAGQCHHETSPQSFSNQSHGREGPVGIQKVPSSPPHAGMSLPSSFLRERPPGSKVKHFLLVWKVGELQALGPRGNNSPGKEVFNGSNLPGWLKCFGKSGRVTTGLRLLLVQEKFCAHSTDEVI